MSKRRSFLKKVSFRKIIHVDAWTIEVTVHEGSTNPIEPLSPGIFLKLNTPRRFIKMNYDKCKELIEVLTSALAHYSNTTFDFEWNTHPGFVREIEEQDKLLELFEEEEEEDS